MNHGDAAPLAVGGIVPVSFLSHGVHVQKKMLPCLRAFHALASSPPPLPQIMMSDNNMPCRSRRLLQLEPKAGILPLPVAAPPPVKRTPALPPVVLRVMLLHGSPAPIGYFYNATPDLDRGLLATALAFLSH